MTLEAALVENQQLRQSVETTQRTLQELRQAYTLLEQQIAWLKKQLYGSGKSERQDATQLRLQLEELEKLQAQVAPPEPQTVSYERPAAKPRPSPAERFKDLPVTETVELVPEEVQAQPELYQRIGQEETFEVDIVPPRLIKRLIIRHKFAHRINRAAPPIIAPAPPRVVEGGYASAGLLAWVVLSKYLDHLPLYRQEKMSERWGARLPRTLMADWVQVVAEWLQPIYGRMRQVLLSGDYVQADETPVRFIDPDLKRGKARQGFLWVIGKPGSDVVFDWRLSRRHGEATSLLEDFGGILQADGYEAYESFARSRETVVLAGCWAHVRRKFVEAAEESPQWAGLLLRLIGQMYHREAQWDAAGISPKLRAVQRQSHHGLTLRLIRRVALSLRTRSLPKSGLGQACGYLLGQGDKLLVFLEHGQLRIDNNLIENAIRPSALGKKNWLFIGHPQAGQRSAIIYSIVVSCQRHGIDPHTYLREVLTRLPSMTNQDDLTPLLPGTWQPLAAT